MLQSLSKLRNSVDKDKRLEDSDSKTSPSKNELQVSHTKIPGLMIVTEEFDQDDEH